MDYCLLLAYFTLFIIKFKHNLVNWGWFRIIILIGLSFYLIIKIEFKDVIYLEWSFREFLTCNFRFLLILDFISLFFLLTVGLISFRVLVFRKSYIINEVYTLRFYLILIIFITSMVLLILRPRLVSCLLGWDGLGLRSYLLVIFYSNRKSYNSGIITALTNRFGDILIIFSITIFIININWSIGAANFQLRSKVWAWILVIATFTKRAQIPFSAWLPAAMAAPTPVSSLVHSSTLVTAGVYLLIRFDSWFFNLNSLKYLAALGRATSLIAGLNALLETDLKKIVALSTLRQLGLIVWFLGIGLSKVSFIHLIAHAFFKAMLFVGTGNIIHGSRSGQDLRWMGGTSQIFRQTKRMVILANFRLIGLPFISAFFSKEILLENLSIKHVNLFEAFIFYGRVILTLVYSIRFIIFFYVLSPKVFRLNNMVDRDFLTILSIRILIIPALTGGKLLAEFRLLTAYSLSNRIIYQLIAWSLVARFLLSFLTWPLISFVTLNTINKKTISMWGLRTISYYAGVVFSLGTSLLVSKKVDMGIQTRNFKNLVTVGTLVFRIRGLAKSLKRFLFIVLIWFLIYANYYLNNKIQRGTQLEPLIN